MGVFPRPNRQVTLHLKKFSLLTAVMFGFLVRVLSLDYQDMWRDEVDQWRFALSPLSVQLSHLFESGWNGPLFSPVLRLWIEVTGESVFAMRYLSLLCGVLNIVLIYILCSRLTITKTAYWSAWLCAFSPYMVWYAQEVKMYTWVPMLVLVGFYGLVRACHNPGWKWWLVTFTATTLAFYSHILAALMIPVQFIWFWFTPNRHKRAWVGAILVFFLLIGPYLPLFIWQLPMVFTARETGYPAFTFLEMVTALITGWTSGIYMGAWTGGTISHAITAFVCACAIIGLSGPFGKTIHRNLKLLVWLLLPLITIWFISLKSPIFTDRYLIWTAPVFYILVASGISQFARVNRIFMWCIGLCILASTVPALFSQSTYAIKPQYKIAANYVMKHSSVNDLLLFQIPYNAQVFEFYTQNQVYLQEDAPYTNWKLADGSYQVGESYVHQEMARIVSDYSRIWLVYSEVKLWDQRELVKRWLDTRWILFDEQQYQGVALYAYQRP